MCIRDSRYSLVENPNTNQYTSLKILKKDVYKRQDLGDAMIKSGINGKHFTVNALLYCNNPLHKAIAGEEAPSPTHSPEHLL